MLTRARVVVRPRQEMREAVPGTPGPPPDRAILRAQMAAYRHARSCLYREQCGCVYAECWWKQRKVTLQECAECIKG